MPKVKSRKGSLAQFVAIGLHAPYDPRPQLDPKKLALVNRIRAAHEARKK